MHLLNEIELRECFNSGRFHKQPTVFFGTLEYNPGCPLEFTVLNDKMAEIGACWESDIQRVLDNAVEAGMDAVRLNPNVRVFNVALQQIQDFKRKVVMAEEAERRFRDGKVISFADPRLV